MFLWMIANATTSQNDFKNIYKNYICWCIYLITNKKKLTIFNIELENAKN